MDSKSIPDPIGAPPTVLFVDDDSDTLEMYAAYFEMSGLQVATSTTPAEALRRVAARCPDLVVTDVGFAGQQAGLDFVSTLKSEEGTSRVPVIVLTGCALEQVPVATREQADLCLVKPVLPDSLLMDVQRLISVSQARPDQAGLPREQSTGAVAPPSPLDASRRGVSSALK
jgi:CheY-like chemotaxis protein